MAAACHVEGDVFSFSDIGEPVRRTSSGLMLCQEVVGANEGGVAAIEVPSLRCHWSTGGRGARNIRSPAQHSLHVRVSELVIVIGAIKCLPTTNGHFTPLCCAALEWQLLVTFPR